MEIFNFSSDTYQEYHHNRKQKAAELEQENRDEWFRSAILCCNAVFTSHSYKTFVARVS